MIPSYYGTSIASEGLVGYVGRQIFVIQQAQEWFQNLTRLYGWILRLVEGSMARRQSPRPNLLLPLD